MNMKQIRVIIGCVFLSALFCLFIETAKADNNRKNTKLPASGILDNPKLSVSVEMPFGLSNPYEQDDIVAKESLPEILRDLGLTMDENGAGFVVDEIARKRAERKCNDAKCKKFDFSQAKNLIDLVSGQGKTNLWIVIGSPSKYKFTDGIIRSNGKTYLPDGPISRQAYKDYLIALIDFVNSYGRKVSGNPDWYVVCWNLYNEVNAEYRDTFKDIDRAATAYSNFVIDSAEILRNLSPQSKIVLAGAGSATDLLGKHGEFYQLVFLKLKQANLSYEPFDYWESHWFGKFKNYAKNEAGYGVKDFIDFLSVNGYGDKKFLIRAGGTYSGQDTQERKHLTDNYQSERDQSEFLVKRFIYNVAAGAKKIPWSTVYEHNEYQSGLHVLFNYIGLLYNGIPDGVSEKQKCTQGWLPCPDPGAGVKKLSYYTFKHLIEKLKGSDFDNIEVINDGNRDNLYLYKFNKQGLSIWVAWNDNIASKIIEISTGNARQVKITEAVPKYESGKEVVNYNIAFNTETKSISDGKITITLKDKPVFVEEK